MAEGEGFLRYRALGFYVLEFEFSLRGPGATFTELSSSADVRRRVLLENYYLPGDLEVQIGALIEHYNNRRHHENLGNLTPADVNHGRAASIIKLTERIKKPTFELRRLAHRRQSA